MVDPDLAGGSHRPRVSRTGAPAPAWLEELVLAPGPPWLHMGLRTIDEATWLDIDDRRDDELALKATLLAEREDEVFAALGGTEAAGAEVLGLVEGWLAAHAPRLRPGLEPPPRPEGARHPLATAGLLVQEDLCLMAERDGEVQLVAASLSFPSHWRLREKLGRSAAAIHQPVPHYPDELEAKVDRYLERIPDGRIAVRRNWAVHDHADLFAPDHRPPAAGVTAANAGERLWLRSERQTLRRLPGSGAVLFTIRVQVEPFGVLGSRPDLAAALIDVAHASEAAGHDRIRGHLGAASAWVAALTTER